MEHSNYVYSQCVRCLAHFIFCSIFRSIFILKLIFLSLSLSLPGARARVALFVSVRPTDAAEFNINNNMNSRYVQFVRMTWATPNNAHISFATFHLTKDKNFIQTAAWNVNLYDYMTRARETAGMRARARESLSFNSNDPVRHFITAPRLKHNTSKYTQLVRR